MAWWQITFQSQIVGMLGVYQTGVRSVVQRNDHLLGLRQRTGGTAQNHAPAKRRAVAKRVSRRMVDMVSPHGAVTGKPRLMMTVL